MPIGLVNLELGKQHVALLNTFIIRSGKQKARVGCGLLAPHREGRSDAAKCVYRPLEHLSRIWKIKAMNQSCLSIYEILIIQLNFFSSPTNLIFSKAIYREQFSESTL